MHTHNWECVCKISILHMHMVEYNVIKAGPASQTDNPMTAHRMVLVYLVEIRKKD